MVETTRRTLIAAAPLGLGLATLSLLPARRALAQVAPDGFTVMASDPRFRTWVSIVQASGLAPYARGATPYTVFAPTEAAFNRYPTMRQEFLPSGANSFPDTSNLIRLVRTHVMYGLHPKSELEGHRVTVRSVAGTPITVDGSNPQAIAVTWTSPGRGEGTAHLTAAPIQASNAIIYPIDDVILSD